MYNKYIHSTFNQIINQPDTIKHEKLHEQKKDEGVKDDIFMTGLSIVSVIRFALVQSDALACREGSECDVEQQFAMENNINVLWLTADFIPTVSHHGYVVLAMLDWLDDVAAEEKANLIEINFQKHF